MLHCRAAPCAHQLSVATPGHPGCAEDAVPVYTQDGKGAWPSPAAHSVSVQHRPVRKEALCRLCFPAGSSSLQDKEPGR